MGHDARSLGGNMRVFGLDVGSGATLWEFHPEFPVWNLTPLFPGDGTTVFMDFTGGVYRLGLHNGTLQWYTPATRANQAFSDGGAVLGPQGDVYACFNPTGGHGSEGQRGVLRKLQVSDGRVFWDQDLPQPCNSYPAVGKVGPGDELSVVVTPGSFMGSPNLRGSIMAFDVESGALRWAYNTRPFNNPPSYMAKGDTEGYVGRSIHMGKQHNICLPAHWGSANIDGEGYVYAGRCDGYVYAVRAPKDFAAPMERNVSRLLNNFTSTPGLSVRSWNADGPSLHGAFAFAPGRVAFATCDTLYAFNA
uniref:Uncharacterized protein n=2 Tax=Alexandrium catenella TaxID=2925 RepID=A0A7S1WX76_ALECA